MIFFILIWSISSLGFFALASSMSKHQKQIFGHELDAAKTKYAAIEGWTLLITSLIICLLSGAITNMVSYWVAALTFAAFFTGLCLSYLETKIKKIAALTAFIAAISGFIHLI
ncbi:DUF3325 domain-containing protein [Acinetobacter tianfuensis]|uniref:DUF3325 domain-containing protein n=1 Tax=Acinetobacter tianfuensis TaxID=2419603 RepID=A0A3A8EVY4_9GAMM|nr:DUF3325 domain-containing protein [Acinetobacter tianfuensis]RKG32593.1 DUF3325 domain-containing protein [Acinetobacter tianfuensis]